MATWPAPKVADGYWRIAELNCAILDVAREHRLACATELEFIRAVLPGASVQRVSHLLSGGRSCAYEIRMGPVKSQDRQRRGDNFSSGL